MSLPAGPRQRPAANVAPRPDALPPDWKRLLRERLRAVETEHFQTY
jgi:hypothetical protein